MNFTFDLEHIHGQPPKQLIKGLLERYNADLPGRYHFVFKLESNGESLTEERVIKFGRNDVSKKLSLEILPAQNGGDATKEVSVFLQYRHKNWKDYRTGIRQKIRYS